jgi:hypothetical protein
VLWGLTAKGTFGDAVVWVERLCSGPGPVQPLLSGRHSPNCGKAHPFSQYERLHKIQAHPLY